MIGIGLGLWHRPGRLGDDPDTSALFARMTVQPDSTRKTLIADLIKGLKQADIWSRLDAFYVCAAHDQQAAQLNWKPTPAFDLVAVNSPAFTVDRGFMGDGISSHLDTGLNRNALVSYQRDDATLFAYENVTVSISTAYTIGAADIDQARIVGRTGGGSIGWRINDSNSLALATGTGNGYGPGSAGLTAVSRYTSTSRTGFKNGLVGPSDAEPSVALSAGRFYLLRQAAQYAARNITLAGFGSSLTAAQHSQLMALCQAYLTPIGGNITPT